MQFVPLEKFKNTNLLQSALQKKNILNCWKETFKQLEPPFQLACHRSLFPPRKVKLDPGWSKFWQVHGVHPKRQQQDWFTNVHFSFNWTYSFNHERNVNAMNISLRIHLLFCSFWVLIEKNVAKRGSLMTPLLIRTGFFQLESKGGKSSVSGLQDQELPPRWVYFVVFRCLVCLWMWSS